MNLLFVLFMTSVMVLIIGVGMLASLFVGYFCGDSPEVLTRFGVCMATCVFFGVSGIMVARRRRKQKGCFFSLSHSALRESAVSIFFAWLSELLLGGLPFVICCHFLPADAIFETASGITTTGATIIEPGMRLLGGGMLADGLEGLPKVILFWRTMLNWLGGIGFVMFALLILPFRGEGKQLYNAEVPGLKNAFDQEAARISSAVRMTMICYMLWTAAVAVAYRFCGMGSWFDAVCHAFGTVATGGFGNYSDSFAHFSAPLVQWVAIFAMAVSSCNLALMIQLFRHGKFEYFRDEETRKFLWLTLGVTLIFAAQLYWGFGAGQATYLNGEAVPHTVEASLRASAFQVVSVISTTGYGTSDYVQWALPGLSGLILLIMFCGGCGGSTSGGLKMSRVLVVSKQTLGEVHRRIFPHLVPNVMLNRSRLDMRVVRQTMGFVMIYIGVVGVCTLLLPYLSPMDFETALSAAVSAISNVGPGLSRISPASTYAWMSPAAKCLLSFTMIAGRLELYTVFVVFLPSFWKNR